MSFLGRLKGLDLHPKFRDEFMEKTRVGGVVSVLTIIFIFYLTVSNVVSYLSPEIVDRMSVDDSRNIPIRINFDVTFPSLSCSLLSLDAMDVSGQSHGDVANNIFKKRLDLEGKPFEQIIKNELGNSIITKDQLGATPSPEPGAAPECGSCYGAGAEGQCCSSCEEVQGLYLQKGWSFDPAVVAQCAKEHVLAAQAGALPTEGCNVYGFVEVPRVAGNIHFAPGRSFQSSDMHVHDLMAFTLQTFNVTHTINAFSFSVGTATAGGAGGSKSNVDEQARFAKLLNWASMSQRKLLQQAGAVNPLEGHSKVLPTGQGNGMFQYYIKVVPTDYKISPENTMSTYQYSVTEYFRPVSVQKGNGLPGVFFFYDLSSIRVTMEPHGMTLSHLVTNLSAIAGGVFTVMGLFDKGVYLLMRYFKSKKAIA